jgi:RNA polymerase sigma-70 factor (ECF subfamily)
VRARFSTTDGAEPAAVTDEQLIDSLAAGDELALGALYDRLGGLAYGLARRVARDSALAEEAVQEAFLAVWRSAGRFDERRGSARGWVMTLVHRRAVDLVRREALRCDVPLEAAPEPAGSSAAEEVDVRAERRRVRTALEALPTAQRRVIELAYYGGCTQSEIARLLDVPLGTIKSRMFVGLLTLRDSLEVDDVGHLPSGCGEEQSPVTGPAPADLHGRNGHHATGRDAPA